MANFSSINLPTNIEISNLMKQLLRAQQRKQQ